MKVLLTGASGFVGSHILDQLRARNIDAAVLLRPTSDKRFISAHLREVEVRFGSIAEPSSLKAALDGITHVVHCAGCTKAARNTEFYQVNQLGTQNVVAAVNVLGGQIKRLLHVSSLAVAGPAPSTRPARETDSPNPISEYGRSKLAAELEIKNQCRAAYTIIRPPAVYGPRDQGFHSLFRAVKHHLRPQPSASQALSLVYAPDLAGAIVACLDHPATAGRTYFVASPEIVTARGMANEIARQLNIWTLRFPLPPAALWPLCLAQEVLSRATGKAMLLNLQKYAELRAPGWVCDPTQLKVDTGYECKTTLEQGIAATLAWYAQNNWI